jgi:hypothetical protein
MTKDEKIAKVKEILLDCSIYISGDGEAYLGASLWAPIFTESADMSYIEYSIKISEGLINDLAELIND